MEVGREQVEHRPACRRPLTGRPSHERAEDGNQRQRQHHHDTGEHVVCEHPDEDRDRGHDGEDELRQEAAEVRLERVEALHGGGRDLTGGALDRGGRAGTEQVREEPSPEGRGDAEGGQPAAALERPQQAGTHDRRRDHAEEQRRHLGDVVAVDEDAGDRVGEQHRLSDDGDGDHGGCEARSDEVAPEAGCLSQEPGIDSAHRVAMFECRLPTERRNASMVGRQARRRGDGAVKPPAPARSRRAVIGSRRASGVAERDVREDAVEPARLTPGPRTEQPQRHRDEDEPDQERIECDGDAEDDTHLLRR